MSDTYDAATEIRGAVLAVKEALEENTQALENSDETGRAIAAQLGNISDTLKQMLIAMQAANAIRNE